MGEVISMLTYKQDKEAKIIAEEEAEMERQYQEFISLLRYFVFIQDPKCDRINLLFDDNGDCIIKDIDFNEVAVDKEHWKLNDEIDTENFFEDFIISTLISLAPQTIQVFNSNKIPEKLKETLIGIFGDKVSFSNRKEKRTGNDKTSGN